MKNKFIKKLSWPLFSKSSTFLTTAFSIEDRNSWNPEQRQVIELFILHHSVNLRLKKYSQFWSDYLYDNGNQDSSSVGNKLEGLRLIKKLEDYYKLEVEVSRSEDEESGHDEL